MKNHRLSLVVSLTALLLVLTSCFISSLRAQEAPYYQGKTIRIVVGFTPGGFYDRWARLSARYLPKYIPGSPEIIVQNMAGAGGLIAANHVYAVAKPDGLTLGALSYGAYLDQLVGRKEVQYDVRKFLWIGSPEKSDVGRDEGQACIGEWTHADTLNMNPKRPSRDELQGRAFLSRQSWQSDAEGQELGVGHLGLGMRNWDLACVLT